MRKRTSSLWYLIHGPNIPGSYTTLFFTDLDLTFSTMHIHSWATFLLCPNHFIFSGTISINNSLLFFPNSIMNTFWPGGSSSGLIFLLPFCTVHGVLAARILEWLVISSFSEPWFVRTVQYDSSVLYSPAWHSSELHCITQVPLPWQSCVPWRGNIL